eukprot:5486716-Pyramimonas_sp.AAC.1
MGEAAAGHASDAPKGWNTSLVGDWVNLQDSLLSFTEYRNVDGATEVNPMCDIENKMTVCPHDFEASQSEQRPTIIGPDTIESGLLGRA